MCSEATNCLIQFAIQSTSVYCCIAFSVCPSAVCHYELLAVEVDFIDSFIFARRWRRDCRIPLKFLMLPGAVTVKRYRDYWVRCMAKIIKIMVHNNGS